MCFNYTGEGGKLIMDELVLKAEKRDVLGKKTRFLRRQGITPAHLIGHNLESRSIQCDTSELQKIIANAGATRLITLKIAGEKSPHSVFVKEVQQDPLQKQLFHVDFYQVRKGEKMQVVVPIVIVGESPALKFSGRFLTHGLTELTIDCLPDKVPPQIDIDISVLEELDQSIFIKDIVLDSDITVHADPEQLIVKISEAFVKPEEEEVVAEEEEAAEAAEGEAPAAEAPEQPAAESEATKE
jgi:large subunit ribosomal protein L25